MSMSSGSLLASFLGGALGLAVAACSSADSTGSPATSTKSCGTLTSPEALSVKDVVPASGSLVPNESIVHGFTVVAAPGLFQTLKLGYLAGKHTAGDADPAAWSFTATTSGRDVRYQAVGVKWAKAPGHVAIGAVERFQTTDGCVYSLPEPLFEYDIQVAGAGGGGPGGSGQGGSGQGGSGQGGSAQGGSGPGGSGQGGTAGAGGQ